MIQECNNYSLLPHNTFGIDVKTAHFIEYDTEEDLRRLFTSGKVARPWLPIGSGSNLLFLKDYEGTILHSRINYLKLTDETKEKVHICVGSGVEWDDFVAYCVQHGWYGAENLSLIPGEVGAAAVQNIGAYGVEVKDIIESVTTMDVQGNEQVYAVEACHYGYRHSIFKEIEMQNKIVTSVCFCLRKTEGFTLNYGTIREELKNYSGEPTLPNVRQAIIDIRKNKLPDPSVVGNAGSFFMNPVVDRTKYESLKNDYPDMPYYNVDETRVKIPAAWMIDRCGWKGQTRGAVGVHDKQALVLINKGGAKGSEVAALAEEIKLSVFQQFKIDIFPEVKFV
ncbi:UDP-N-acetylmuramate dehydrogenase [uncultured Bacteroides sp.]|uniref:UDP-N-acetylmuramate dehydrogenase n=1 Tax=uncultured Bacteroides sp. TaxID=162156 RepID=UPI002AA60519|nr:UDP-N-acetylmuramate dehydrogenase [uncultured Bacteroides sp.]